MLVLDLILSADFNLTLSLGLGSWRDLLFGLS